MPELTAGSQLVVPARHSHGCGEIFGEKTFLKFDNIVGGRGKELAIFERIKADETDFSGDRVESFDKQIGIVWGMVKIFDDDIFEGDALSLVEGEFSQGIKELIERPDTVSGHNPAAQFIACGMQTDGKVNAEIFRGEFLKPRNMSNGREGNFASGEVEAGGMEQDFDGAHDVIVVVEGFTHAHEDEVGDASLLFIGDFLRHENLLEDFVGGEISPKTKRCSSAEGAAEFAADLRGDAEGESVWGRDENGFDDIAVIEGEGDFIGAVFGDMFLWRWEGRQDEMFF